MAARAKAARARYWSGDQQRIEGGRIDQGLNAARLPLWIRVFHRRAARRQKFRRGCHTRRCCLVMMSEPTAGPDHDREDQPFRRRPFADEGMASRVACDRLQPGPETRASCGDPRFADQRLRELPQHAHRLRARERRNRAAHQPLAGLARVSLLYRSRTRGACVDRSADDDFGRPCTCRRLQGPAGAVHGGRTGEAHADDQRHQRVEPPLGRLRPVGRSRAGQGDEQNGRLMMNTTHEGAAATFEPLRPKLMRVAYRMLGSVADAEDAVQEAFIRWMRADRSEVREPEAFLRRTVTRLCLDQLKSARHQRETYVGPWLPEPVVEETEE